MPFRARAETKAKLYRRVRHFAHRTGRRRMSGRKTFSKELRGRERIATFPPHDLQVKGRDISNQRTFWHSENVKKRTAG